MSSEVDTLLDLLRAERRRTVLELLYVLQLEEESDDVTIQIPDLARQVAATEADVDSATVGRTVQRSLNLGLRHTHLPMLDDYGVIEYDPDANEVSMMDQIRPVVETMQSIMETVEDTDDGLKSTVDT